MANMSTNGGTENGTDATTTATFRNKAAFMKSWRPENTPSNRDRLELYALHKQAVSGDAPNSIPASASVSEKAKYQAWRGKRGLTQQEAMTMYVAECDRQLRVYGNSPQTPSNTPLSPNRESVVMTPRGLAAVPLLCAAASESRVAYLRRLAQTAPDTGWWSRQEPLCASPGTLGALPEQSLLAVAALVEKASLQWAGGVLPYTVLQSFLWPLHNCLLSLWIALILVITIMGAALTLVSTILWGARRTGIPLVQIWREEIQPAATAISSLTEAHQPMAVRLVGLMMLPFGFIEGFTNVMCDSIGMLWGSVSYALVMILGTWWYWLCCVPWLCLCLLGAAALSGNCFALIDLAGI
jgi:diazepam-binding inhibitor (GABA receptor modulating acyl-CoA-binding protein)